MKTEIYKSATISILFSILRVISFILTANFLSPEAFGIFAFHGAVYVFQITLYEVALFPYLIRNDMKYRDSARSDISLCQSINYIFALILLLLLVSDFEIWSIIVMFIVNIIINFINGETYKYLIKVRMHKKQSFELRIEAMSFAVSLFGVALPILIYSSSDVDLLFIFLSQILLRLGLFNKILRSEGCLNSISYKGTFELLMKIKIEGVRMFTIALYRQAPSLLVGLFMGNTALGLFNRSGFIGEQITTIINKAFNFIVLREFSLTVDKQKYLRFDTVATLLVLLVLPALYYTSLPVTHLILKAMGNNWLELRPLIVIFLMIVPIKVLSFFSIQILKASGDRNLIVVLNICSILFLIAAMVFCDDLVTFSRLVVLDSIVQKIVLSLAIRRLHSKARDH